MLPCVSGIFYRLPWQKTNWLVMCEAVSQIVYLLKLMKYKGVVVLYCRRAAWFCRKNLQ